MSKKFSLFHNVQPQEGNPRILLRSTPSNTNEILAPPAKRRKYVRPLLQPDRLFVTFTGVASYWSSLNCLDPEGCQLSMASLRLVCKTAKRACDVFIVDRASFFGSVSGMVKLYGIGFRPTDDCCHLAASRGNLSCLIFAYRHLYVELGESLAIAQSCGFTDIIEFACKAGWPFPKPKNELRWTEADQQDYFDAFQ